MSSGLRYFLFLVFMTMLVANAQLSYAAGGHGEKDHSGPFNPTHMIAHHIGDDYRFPIIGHLYLPLPVILYHKNEGLTVFIFSRFVDEDHNFVPYKGYIYDPDHAKIKRVDEDKFFDISITKNVFEMIVVAVLMLIMFIPVAKAYRKRPNAAPKGFQSFIEPIVVFVRDDIARRSIGDAKYEKYVPYLLTLFFFIWLNNLIGLVPIFPGSANVTGNIAVTFALAAVSLVVINVSGNKHYWQHILWPPGMPVFVKLILVPIEIIGIIAKPFALMVRLFANMVGGHIVILSIVSLIFILGPQLGPVGGIGIGIGAVLFNVFLYFIKLFVAALQAFIFTLLTALFTGMAVEEPAHH